MKSLLEMKRAGDLCSADGTAGIRLIYIDPPFATKRDFTGKQEERAYQDKIAGARFVEFLRRRLVFIRELLADDGSTICIWIKRRRITQRSSSMRYSVSTISGMRSFGETPIPTIKPKPLGRFTNHFFFIQRPTYFTSVKPTGHDSESISKATTGTPMTRAGIASPTSRGMEFGTATRGKSGKATIRRRKTATGRSRATFTNSLRMTSPSCPS